MQRRGERTCKGTKKDGSNPRTARQSQSTPAKEEIFLIEWSRRARWDEKKDRSERVVVEEHRGAPDRKKLQIVRVSKSKALLRMVNDRRKNREDRGSPRTNSKPSDGAFPPLSCGGRGTPRCAGEGKGIPRLCWPRRKSIRQKVFGRMRSPCA